MDYLVHFGHLMVNFADAHIELIAFVFALLIWKICYKIYSFFCHGKMIWKIAKDVASYAADKYRERKANAAR